mmetsp:Transcript_8381/g.31019  ORF Transcript_8381/g.31019 Transcript_8381/m.31019 type:complete len:125 (-) Transcript_8381:2386-2760(-)
MCLVAKVIQEHDHQYIRFWGVNSLQMLNFLAESQGSSSNQSGDGNCLDVINCNMAHLLSFTNFTLVFSPTLFDHCSSCCTALLTSIEYLFTLKRRMGISSLSGVASFPLEHDVDTLRVTHLRVS